MNLKIIIDKLGNVPVYMQIVEKITLFVRDGMIKVGARLPSEREMAEKLSVARGTVRKAYETLRSNRIVELNSRNGYFISSIQDVVNESRKDKAVRIIENSISELEKMKLKSREIANLFHILLANREKKRDAVQIAGVDCNPEALQIFDDQLRHISKIRLHKFTLNEFICVPDIADRMSEFDLILTTTTHYKEICDALPSLTERIIQATVSPGQQTIIDLAKIPSGSKIGVLTRSVNFYRIIEQKLKDFQFEGKKIRHILEADTEKFQKFIEGLDFLITPPECGLEGKKEFQPYFEKFKDSGGMTIRFEYQLDRGSLMRIEEKIADIIEKKRDK